MARKLRATHEPLPSGRYTEARYVTTKPINDPTKDEGLHPNWHSEKALTEEEMKQVLDQDWQCILPGGTKKPQIKRTPRKPRGWAMSPTRDERHEAHRLRIEALKLQPAPDHSQCEHSQERPMSRREVEASLDNGPGPHLL